MGAEIMFFNLLRDMVGDMEPQVGCWNVGLVNEKSGEECETQGDMMPGMTWADFAGWLAYDAKEAGIGPVGELKISYIEYAGIDDPACFV